MKNSKHVNVPFTEERWNNWIECTKQSDYKNMDEKSTAVFVDMEEDVIIACCKLIRGFEIGKLSQDESLQAIKNIESITQKRLDTGDEQLNDLIELIQASLIGAFASFESYMKNTYADSPAINQLVQEALDQEKKGHLELALAIVGKVGARVIAGDSLNQDALADLEDSYVAEWLDGVDSIAAATTSYIEYDSGDESA
jgi:hypothetical protein